MLRSWLAMSVAKKNKKNQATDQIKKSKRSVCLAQMQGTGEGEVEGAVEQTLERG